MKKVLLTTGAALSIFVLLFGMNTLNYKSNHKKATAVVKDTSTTDVAAGFALVELFTSEGCSSCPPADELVNKLAREKKQNVFILSYHVDYWNRLGWKDKFSKAEFSNRQQQYATHFNKNGVYTPQIVVNGATEFVGSDEKKLYATINKTTAETANEQINISANLVGDKIVVGFKPDKKYNTAINIALVQLAGSSQVKNGENEGRFLQHTNIVSDLKSLPADGSNIEIRFSLPTGFTAAAYKVVAFLQKESGEVIAANESNIK